MCIDQVNDVPIDFCSALLFLHPSRTLAGRMIPFLIAFLSLFTSPCPSATATMTSSRRHTLIVGLNPALQRTVILSSTLQSGSVNRGSSVEVQEMQFNIRRI